MRLSALAALALLLPGCAGASAQNRLFAEVPQLLCKHCNCYFPATADMEAPCAACDCGYSYRKCARP